MLQEIKDLQNGAVTQLFERMYRKKELTFRAPTGSGKTRMMGDLMNRVLHKEDDVVFLVSSLSKGDLARQNYESFLACVQDSTFPNLNPYLISSEVSNEESLFIPTDYNVYVLPRDLFKKQSKLMAGPMVNFLNQLTEGSLFGGQNKRIYLIKDECHQATNNLDAISNKYFDKILNFSATPNLKRGQAPDVQITDEEAVQAKLIKQVEFCDDTDTVEDAICKFEEIQTQYTSLSVNPCLIIQISNKDKAEEEWQQIHKVLDKVEHQQLKWMLIVDNAKMCDTNDDLKKLPVSRWKDYAKRNTSSIDIIVFKMTISEGWDIPRACMLYQVRDTQSKQLDEQVMGRVRRNPRLTDFETLTEEQKQLATTAWVWGIPPESAKKTLQVSLWQDGTDIQQSIALKTIYLKSLTTRKDFDINRFLENSKSNIVNDNIFILYQQLQNCDTEIQELCYQYAQDDPAKWYKFMGNIGEIRKAYNEYIVDYDQSMAVSDETHSFPVRSYYIDNDTHSRVKGWIWRKQEGNSYSFDSEAEIDWVDILQDAAEEYGAKLEEKDLIGTNTCYLWGKNFLPGSEIRYEYYSQGIHSSYPDFIMKDHKGTIHLFEVKSVNLSNSQNIDSEEYKNKIRALKDCYLACSKKLSGYIFYLPVLEHRVWQITRYKDGIEDTITKEQFIDSLK